MKVHLCNLMGMNKIPMEERLAFTDDNIDNVIASAEDPISNRWWLEAEDPFQFLACCIEIASAVESGDPESYECHLPVHQDGSCNGLQHYAALGRDEKGGRAVNLTPSDVPQDVYTDVMVMVKAEIAKHAALVNRPVI